MAAYLAGREPEALAALYDQRRADFDMVVASAERFGPRALHYDLEVLGPKVGVWQTLAGTLLDGPGGDFYRRQEQAAWEVSRGYAASKAFSPEGYEPDVPMEPNEADLEVLAQLAAQPQVSKSSSKAQAPPLSIVDSSTFVLAGTAALIAYMVTADSRG